MPLALTDDELSAVQRAAAPIHPGQRDAFLKALAEELELHPIVGPGLVHRLAAELQRRFVIAPERGTSVTAEPREQLAPGVALRSMTSSRLGGAGSLPRR
jgi:hypothetical protein